MKRFIKYIFIILIISGCDKEVILDLPIPEEQIVVDGYIEAGENPFVFLTKSVPYFGEIDSSMIRGLAITTAKITVSTDDESEILTLQVNSDLMPPFVYRATSMVGIVGKKYDIKVEVGGKVITSSTTIPNIVPIDSVWFESIENTDNGIIWIKGIDPIFESNYYRVLTKRKGIDETFIPSIIFSAFNDQNFSNGLFKLPIYKGVSDYSNPLQDIYFSNSDSVFVKLSSIDKESYDCWISIQNEMVNYGNFSEPNNPIVSNINGGIGVWSGYGSYTFLFIP